MFSLNFYIKSCYFWIYGCIYIKIIFWSKKVISKSYIRYKLFSTNLYKYIILSLTIFTRLLSQIKSLIFLTEILNEFDSQLSPIFTGLNFKWDFSEYSRRMQNYWKTSYSSKIFYAYAFYWKIGAKFILRNLLELYITTRLENYSLSRKKN